MTAPSVQYRVVGMDCAEDARAIEAALKKLDGVEAVHVSTASQILTLTAAPTIRLGGLDAAIAPLGFHLESATEAAVVSPAYRRALWIVVVLNVGYGVIEMLGGFWSESQAVKADALDFLGDGVITLLGVLAIGWSLVWRARAALIQGIFLGLLGIGVLGTTAYRVLVQHEPDAEWMGVLGFVALLVNIAATVVLLPHRTGDSNVRAVWLFSRNDAIGNAAVVVAALLVGWLNTPWPDLVVAVAIAALFLQSAWSIVSDARRDLRSTVS
jgi:Co/Zn/Cd efflux system component